MFSFFSNFEKSIFLYEQIIINFTKFAKMGQKRKKKFPKIHILKDKE